MNYSSQNIVNEESSDNRHLFIALDDSITGVHINVGTVPKVAMGNWRSIKIMPFCFMTTWLCLIRQQT